MDPERNIVPFTAPEMIELKRLRKQREEAKEEQERFRLAAEKFERAWEQKERPKREGRLKVAEWCFLNFSVFEETTRERNERIGEEPRALTELHHFLRTGSWAYSRLLEGTPVLVGITDTKASRRLLSIYRRIAKQCPPPFTEEELIQWGLVELPDLIVSEEQVMKSNPNLAILQAMTHQELINVTLEELVQLLALTGRPERTGWPPYTEWKKRLGPENWQELWNKIIYCYHLALEDGADGYDEIQKTLDEKRNGGLGHEALEDFFEAVTKERVLIKLRASKAHEAGQKPE